MADLYKDIEKLYGEGVIRDASSLLDEEKITVPVGPKLDLSLGGGIPEGSWCIFSGKRKIGKTTTALQMAANAQKKEYGNKKIFVLDVEGRLKKMNIEGVHGLDPKGVQVINSIPERILSGEDYLQIACNILSTERGCVLIIDSLSALCSSSELTNDINGQTRSVGPKNVAAFCRKMANVVPVQNSIVVSIQHLIANTSGYGSPFMEDSGNKIQYQVDVWLRAVGVSKWKKGENLIGQIVKWDIIASANGPPGDGVESSIRYGYGIDEYKEILDICTDLGIVELKGAWYNFTIDGKPLKAQGEEKAIELLQQGDNFAKVSKALKEIM